MPASRIALQSCCWFAGALLAQAAPQSPPHASDYVVLTTVPAGDPWRAAAERLAKLHGVAVQQFDPQRLDDLRKALAAQAPRDVAVVLRPEQLDFAFARAFLQLATELDDDPFVDFAYGFVTGRDGDAALRFVEAEAAAAKAGPRPVRRIGEVIGGVDTSRLQQQRWMLHKGSLPATYGFVAGKDGDHDRAFVADKVWPALHDCDAVMFVGHGMPGEVVGGPDAADVKDLRLPGAVVLNVACYTGVTHGWFEEDWRARKLVGRVVDAGQSFALQLLDSGAIGYTAYTCPRPAGPELDTDLAALVADGSSLGTARRRDYDKTVLGALGFGRERLQLEAPADGKALPDAPDPVRDMMLEGATGGVLFGDPALVPFAAAPGGAPVQVRCERAASSVAVTITCPPASLFLQCNDPTATFGGGMAMKAYARVPIGRSRIADVVVDSVKVGGADQPTRRVCAFEEDHGEHFAQLKVLFPRSSAGGELVAKLTVKLTDDPAAARARIVDPPPAAAKAQAEPKGQGFEVFVAEPTPALLELAAARKVSPPALRAALAATRAELKLGGLEPAAAGDALAKYGDEGFRALCALIESGIAHYRTPDLLARCWRPGAEAQLLVLAERQTLPNFGLWSVLEGLGVADTPAVRDYLLRRLAREDDAGLFMATAAGLARLREAKAVPRIAAVLLEQRQGWKGVEPHLAQSLESLGGDEATAAVARWRERTAKK